MGIRYYAYPVSPEFAGLAAASPRDFIDRDPLMDASGPDEDRPRMLYLDKCWSHLQFLFAPTEHRDQPAYELVRGEVTQHHDGWESFVRYLSNEQVREIAEDLADAAASDCFVMEGIAEFRGRGRSDRDFEQDVEYTQHYLRAAATFTAGVAEAGEGLVYVIG